MTFTLKKTIGSHKGHHTTLMTECSVKTKIYKFQLNVHNNID